METLLGNPREEEGKLHTWRKKQVAGSQRLCFQCPFLGKLHFGVCVGGTEGRKESIRVQSVLDLM